MNKFIRVFSIAIISIVSCKHIPKKKSIDRDTSITAITSYNNLFLDSNAIVHFTQNNPAFEPYTEQYIDFYKKRNYQFAWFDSSGVGEQAHNFLNLLNNAVADLKDSSLYNQQLSTLFDNVADTSNKVSKSKESVLTTELLLTGQFFAYTAKMYKGSDIDAEELGWFIPRKKVDLSALLDSTLQSKGKDPAQYVTLNAQYRKLQDYLVKYYELQKQSNWDADTIAYPAKAYKQGQSSPAIAAIKHRLFVLGDMEQEDTTPVFDTTLLRAARSFQRRMGLSTDGAIGSKMISELNDSIENRIRQLLVNMERCRWMPAETDSPHILVNIPEYKLHVYDSGKLAFDMNVIVGSAANSTVIFTGNLKYVVFSPYWNVPPSIVQKEILPGIKKDPDYLAKHHMEITSNKGSLPEIRQKPGEDNSLGLVKFLFPNNYNIYLHDTPNRDLFSNNNRSLSHGCIRISDPPKMAAYLLRDDTTWTPKKIDSCMHLTNEKWVTLRNPIRVFIGYFTAWVDQNGKLNFRKDIYGHDQKMADKLFVKK